MTANGTLALVTADRWLLNSTTADLREKLGQQNGIAHLVRLDPSTSFYRPKFRQTGTPPRIHPVAIVISRMTSGHKPITRAPIYPPDINIIPDIGDDEQTMSLSELCEIRLAPWLGPKGIFYLSRTEAESRNIPHNSMIAVVDTKNLPPNIDELTPSTMVAIRTHRDTPPGDAIQTHLKSRLHLMPLRGRQKTWLLPPEPLPTLATAPGILIPRIANRLRAVPIAAYITPISHNFHLIVKPKGITRDQLLQILRHQSVEAYAMNRAPRLENGFFDFRTNFIRALPIPTLLVQHAITNSSSVSK
jgi:hypothetical protein